MKKSIIAKAKPRQTPYKLCDVKGLYMLVNPNGGKYFRYNYRTAEGKVKTLDLGVFPEISLDEAREKVKEAPNFLKQGIDPCEYKRQKKTRRLTKNIPLRPAPAIGM